MYGACACSGLWEYKDYLQGMMNTKMDKTMWHLYNMAPFSTLFPLKVSALSLCIYLRGFTAPWMDRIYGSNVAWLPGFPKLCQKVPSCSGKAEQYQLHILYYLKWTWSTSESFKYGGEIQPYAILNFHECLEQPNLSCQVCLLKNRDNTENCAILET